MMNKALSNRLKKLDNKIPLTYGDLDDETFNIVASSVVNKLLTEEELIESIELLENDIKNGTLEWRRKEEYYIEKFQIKSKQADKILVKCARNEIQTAAKMTEDEIEKEIQKLEQKLNSE